MALIKCPECKRKVSDKAIVCPHCGFTVKDHIENTICIPKRKKRNLNTTLKEIFSWNWADKLLNRISNIPFLGKPLVCLLLSIVGCLLGIVVFGIPLWLIYQTSLLNMKIGLTLLILFANIILVGSTWKDKKSCLAHIVNTMIVIGSIMFCLDLFLSNRWDFLN